MREIYAFGIQPMAASLKNNKKMATTKLAGMK